MTVLMIIVAAVCTVNTVVTAIMYNDDRRGNASASRRVSALSEELQRTAERIDLLTGIVTDLQVQAAQNDSQSVTDDDKKATARQEQYDRMMRYKPPAGLTFGKEEGDDD